MKKFYQQIGWLTLTVGAFFGLKHFCYKQTDGFALNKILSHLEYDARWNSSLDLSQDEAVRTVLAQPFAYLGKGAQCYVFASQDQQYVIKFFRVSHIEAPLWLKELPLPSSLEKWRQQKIAAKENKRVKDFSSYQFAFEHLKDETGLIYLHLTKTSHLKQKIKIIDKVGIAHILDLDQMEFILQKRAKPFYAAMEELIQKNQTEKAKSALVGLIHLLAKRHDAGLTDKDPDLKTNFGLIDAEPIQFDIGRFKKGESNKKNEPFQHEVLRITDHFKQWLLPRQPELASYLDQQIQAIP